MKKFGFTLAELLITLGIVGVVAVLTAPTLITSGQNRANAARLSVVVSTLENAFATAIVKDGVADLYGTRMWSVVKASGNGDKVTLNWEASEDNIAEFVGELGRYMHLNGFKKESYKTYYGSVGPYAMTSSGGKGTKADLGGPFPIELKNGAVIFIRAFANGDSSERTEDDIVKLGGTLYTNAADVFIDVNGKNAPNIVGRDLFTFYVGGDGTLFPAGGVDVSIFDHGNKVQIWSNSSSIGDNGAGWACLPEKDKVANSGWGCTARVIEEGYQINY